MSKVVSQSPYAVEMPDGLVREVRRQYDGPDLKGYYTKDENGQRVDTTVNDYDEYQARYSARYQKERAEVERMIERINAQNS